MRPSSGRRWNLVHNAPTPPHGRAVGRRPAGGGGETAGAGSVHTDLAASTAEGNLFGAEAGSELKSRPFRGSATPADPPAGGLFDAGANQRPPSLLSSRSRAERAQAKSGGASAPSQISPDIQAFVENGIPTPQTGRGPALRPSRTLQAPRREVDPAYPNSVTLGLVPRAHPGRRTGCRDDVRPRPNVGMLGRMGPRDKPEDDDQ